MPVQTLSASALRRRSVLERFHKAAQGPEGLFTYPTGAAGVQGLGYPPGLISRLPSPVLRCYCGVGNPFLPELPRPGQTVLDIGCGAGVDTLFAAVQVGAEGELNAARGAAYGVDLSREMLERARENASLAASRNVFFALASAHSLPYADASFDLVISNGVFNLVEDKPRALAEVYRVLRPGGRVHIADQVQRGQVAACAWSPGAGNWAC